MVAGTVHEIIHMDLPPHFHVHVYVLDDGKRETLENWVLSKRTKRFVPIKISQCWNVGFFIFLFIFQTSVSSLCCTTQASRCTASRQSWKH